MMETWDCSRQQPLLKTQELREYDDRRILKCRRQERGRNCEWGSAAFRHPRSAHAAFEPHTDPFVAELAPHSFLFNFYQTLFQNARHCYARAKDALQG